MTEKLGKDGRRSRVLRTREHDGNEIEYAVYRCRVVDARQEELDSGDVGGAQCRGARADGARRIDSVAFDVDMARNRGLGCDERQSQQDVEP